MKFVCFHLHTSGLSPDTAEILELTFQTWENFRRNAPSNDKFRAVGNLELPSFAEAAQRNGYNADAGLALPPLQAGYLKRFFAAVQAADGHVVDSCFGRSGFGWGFIETAARRLGVPLPSFVRLIDVPSLAVPMLAAKKVEGLTMAALAAVTGKAAPTTSLETVERAQDVFESVCRAYVKALVSP